MIISKKEHLEEDNSVGWIECIFESSNILMSTYFPKKETLYISFNRGGVYSYAPVNNNLYSNFENSESQGKFFVENIKKNSDISYLKEFTLFEYEIENAKKILKEWKDQKNQ